MKPLLSILLLSLVGLSCSSISEPTVERIENVKIESFSQSRVSATADMVLLNDNAVTLDLAAADLVAIADGIEVATIKQNYDMTMQANAESKMPMSLDIDLQKIYDSTGDAVEKMNKAIELYSKRELLIQFQGTIKVGRGSAKLSVPIDKEELVKF